MAGAVRHHGPVTGRLDHLSVTASDFAASLRFYDAALAPLGLSRVAEFGDEEEGDAPVEAAAWAASDAAPVIWLVVAQEPTRAVHVAFRVDRPADVRRFHEAAITAGGRSHDAPRRWPIYRRGEYHAIVADPDGNLIEAVSAE
jgi:catechol 2,3-dioxygenase-like lactoylglutathione lyase family enzyme